MDHQQLAKRCECLESNGWLVDGVAWSIELVLCMNGPGLSHLIKSEKEEQVLVPLDEIRALLC